MQNSKFLMFFLKDSYMLLGNSSLPPYCCDISNIGMEYCKVNCSQYLLNISSSRKFWNNIFSMSIPVKFVINQNTLVHNIGSGIHFLHNLSLRSVSNCLFSGLTQITSIFTTFNVILFAFNQRTSCFKSLLSVLLICLMEHCMFNN